MWSKRYMTTVGNKVDMYVSPVIFIQQEKKVLVLGLIS